MIEESKERLNMSTNGKNKSRNREKKKQIKLKESKNQPKSDIILKLEKIKERQIQE